MFEYFITILLLLTCSLCSFITCPHLGSPADLHGMWFPSVRRTLLCLSKLHRCLDKAIFQGLSQEALIACIANVSLSATAISSKKVG